MRSGRRRKEEERLSRFGSSAVVQVVRQCRQTHALRASRAEVIFDCVYV